MRPPPGGGGIARPLEAAELDWAGRLTDGGEVCVFTADADTGAVTGFGECAAGTCATGTCVIGIGAGRSGRGALGDAERIGWAEETIGVSEVVDFTTTSGAGCLIEVSVDVFVATADFLATGFLVVVFFAGVFLAVALSVFTAAPDFLAATFFIGFGSAGCSERTNPSR